MTGAQRPLWYTSDLGLAEDRAAVQSQLMRYQVLFQKLRVPGAIEKSDNIYKLLNGFADVDLTALSSLFYLLERALFQSPVAVFDGEDNRQRFLIEYIPVRQLRDFKAYVETNLSDAFKEPFPGRDSVRAFFVEWTNTVKRVVDMPPDEMKQAGVSELFIADTPSESIALKQWSAQLDEALSSFQRILDEEAARNSAIQSAIEAQQAANAARRAAGEAGALNMGEHFKKIADDEGKSEANWNKILFVLIIAILAMSAFIVYKSVYAQWIQTLLHLIIVLPVIGAATYASKNAGHHRVVARWARTASVQVNSVQAFAEQLSSPANRDELILELGRNVFSTPTYGEPSKVEHFSAIPADIVDAAKEIAKKSVAGSAKD